MAMNESRDQIDKSHQHSYLFTVRVWKEMLSDGQSEWRGQVRSIHTGETQYFREWSMLVDFIKQNLADFKKVYDVKGG